MRLLIPLLCAMSLSAASTGDSDYLPPYDGRAMLGINMTPPSSATQAANGTDPTTGVETQTVYPGTAAERMGVKPGDLIVSFNGGGIASMNDLRNEVAMTGVGGQATVEVLRNGQKLVLSDSLSEWPSSVPYEPIDEAAERRFRDWQKKRLDRTQQAVSSMRKQLEDIERGAQPAAPTGTLDPSQAVTLPASQALSAMPAFRLRLHQSHDSSDSGVVQPGRSVSWDARVLVGTTPPVIF